MRHRESLLCLTVAVVLLLGGAARAQAPAAPATTAMTGSALPRGDVGATIAWFHHKAGSDPYTHWQHDSRWVGVEGGYYWTENLKTEAGFAGTSEDQAWAGSNEVEVDGQHYWESRVTFQRTRRFYVTQLYQFGHNAWVHPFVGAGLQAVREERSGVRYLYASTPSGRNSETPITPTTETVFKGSATAGLKIYVSRRAFLRTDTIFGFAKALDEVVVRFGAGIDF